MMTRALVKIKNLTAHLTVITLVFIIPFLLIIPEAQAQCAGPGDVGNCVNNQTCINWSGSYVAIGPACGSASVGSVTAPQGVREYNYLAGTFGTTTASGLTIFISRGLQLFSVVAGIFMMVNLVKAGYIYITKFDQVSAHQEVRDLLTYSIVGLVIMVAAYAGGGLIGLVFFGDATFVLNPVLEGAVPAP